MKKTLQSLSRIIVAGTILLAVSCNSAQTHDDTDRTESENGSSHPEGSDTSMTDTTRNITSGTGNDVSAAMDAQGFISKNISDNMTEIQLSKLGQQKGSDKRVKELAGKMVTDHNKILNDLKSAAVEKQVTVPADNNAAAPHMETMQSATGKQFDQMWVAHMATMHQTKLAELQNAMNQTQDADVKALATKAYPIVKMHTETLQSLISQLQ